MATEGKGESSTPAVSTTIPLHRQVRNLINELKLLRFFLTGIIKMARLGLS
jgi:hypothetical protein